MHLLSKLRQTKTTRAMLTETHLDVSQLIAPLFVHATLKEKKPIESMPGLFQLTLNDLLAEVEGLMQLGIKAVIVFGIPAHKDAIGSASLDENGIVQQAISLLRQHFEDLLIIADVCFCEYTSHGHCGVMQNEKLNHLATLPHLAKQAVSMARAGAHWVAPSGMIDGMVATIRQALDEAGFHETAILSYSAKYQSHLYGPFREAAEGAPQFGDRSTYQMNPANVLEAIRETRVDIEEGADLVMVKPAGMYLDVICRVKQAFPEVPLCAYQVSGEYTIIHAAAKTGYFDLEKLMHESLISIKRAGADMIITYFAKTYAAMHKAS